MALKNMKKEKLILICVAIIGLSIILSQVIKQSSIEKQANAKIEQERQALIYQIEQDRKAELEKQTNEMLLDACLEDAETAYWDYAELNGNKKDDGSIWALNSVWDTARNNKKIAEDSCYKRYK